MVEIGSSNTFSIREWLAADGDARLVTDSALSSGFACDELGCVAKLADAKSVALVLRPDAFPEDCSRAAVVVTVRDAPPDCAAVTIDRGKTRAYGAMVLRWDGDRWVVSAARPPGYDRPWARALPQPSAAPPPPTARPSAQRDATPREVDLEAGD